MAWNLEQVGGDWVASNGQDTLYLGADLDDALETLMRLSECGNSTQEFVSLQPGQSEAGL